MMTMASLRMIYRFLLFVLVSSLYYVGLIGGQVLWMRSKAQRLAWRKVCLNGWARAVNIVLKARVVTSGPIPQAPFFLVSNHLSYIDIIIFASVLDCVFVSRGDVVSWPGIGILAKSVGTIFLDRENRHDIPRVISLIDQKLAEGLGVIVFPEGTSSKGDKVLPFKTSLLEPAARAGYPVSYASIAYETPPDQPPAYQVVSWWGDSTFVPHLLGLLKVREFTAYITFGDHAIQAEDRKVLARNLWDAVNSCFVPMAEPENEEQSETKPR